MNTAKILAVTIPFAIGWTIGTLLGKAVGGELAVPRIPIITPMWEAISDTATRLINRASRWVSRPHRTANRARQQKCPHSPCRDAQHNHMDQRRALRVQR